MMTKKHFIKIAEILSESNEECITHTALKLSDYFKELNPNFDKERFLKACGVTE